MRKTKNFNISVPELGDRPDITQVSNAIQSLEDALAGTVEMFDGNVQGNTLTLTSPSRTTKRTKYYNGFTCQWVAKAPYNANTIANVNVDGLGNQAVTIGFNIRQGDAIQLKHNGTRFEVVTLNIPRSNSIDSSSDFTIATSLAVKNVNNKVNSNTTNKLDKGGYTGNAQNLKTEIDKNKWFISAKEIGSQEVSTDILEFCKTAETGFYRSGYNGNLWSNLPSGIPGAFTLEITSIGGSYRTVVIKNYFNDLTYSNFYRDGSWSGWMKAYSSFNKPTPSELNVYSKTESDSRFVDVSGDTMNGNLVFNTSNSERVIKSSQNVGYLFNSNGTGIYNWASNFPVMAYNLNEDKFKIYRKGLFSDYVDFSKSITVTEVVNARGLKFTSSTSAILAQSGLNVLRMAGNSVILGTENSTDGKTILYGATNKSILARVKGQTADFEIYHKGNKPTASDVGAYSKSESDASFSKSKSTLPTFDGTNGDFCDKVTPGTYTIHPTVATMIKLPSSVYNYGILNVSYSDNKNRVFLEYIADGGAGRAFLSNYNFANNPESTSITESAWQVVIDKEKDARARTIKTSIPDEDYMNGALAFRLNNSNNQYTRYCNNPSAVRNWLNTINKTGDTISGEFSVSTATEARIKGASTLYGIYFNGGAFGHYDWKNNKSIFIYNGSIEDHNQSMFAIGGIKPVQDIRLSGRVRKYTWNIAIDLYASGRVLVGCTKDTQDGFMDAYDYANLQKLVGGIWYTVTTS